MPNNTAVVDFPSRIGVWWNSEPWPIREAQDIAREIEALGFGSLFMPEGGGKDALVESAAFLAATDRLVVGTGIANIHFRIPTPAEAVPAPWPRSILGDSCSALASATLPLLRSP